MFQLGNFAIDEILSIVSQNPTTDEILYTVDQFSSANIEVSAESTDITDKNGNVIYTRYYAKTGTFTATNALLNANIMNAGSGSDMEIATPENPIKMPIVIHIGAGKSADLSNADLDTLKVIGVYGNGANGIALSQSEIEACLSGTTFTAPEGGDDLPIEYICRVEKTYEGGIKLVNSAKDFPTKQRLTLYASYIDPCNDEPKPCYIVLPAFIADPSMTIGLDRENTEIDLTGNLNIEYCAEDKTLYEMYFPEEVVSV